jgi:hypothetical protein
MSLQYQEGVVWDWRRSATTGRRLLCLHGLHMGHRHLLQTLPVVTLGRVYDRAFVGNIKHYVVAVQRGCGVRLAAG